MLLRHSIHYLLARGLPGLVNFAALLIYTRLLSPDEYGRYALVIAGVSMAGVVVLQWQRLVLARWLSVRKEDSHRFLGEMLRIFAMLSMTASTIGFVAALLWPDPVWQRLLALAVVVFVSHGWVELNLVLASAQLAPGRYGRILGAKTLIALGVGTGLAWFGLGAYAPLLGLVAGCVLAVPLFGLGVWQGVRLARPKKHVLREQLRYGLPLIITFALGWIIASSDRLLIGWLLDVEAVGQYAVGYDLAQHSLGMLLAIIQVAAYPLAVTALENRGVPAATAQIKHNGELILGVALACAAGIAVLAPQIAAVVVGQEFRVMTASLLPWIAFGAAVGGIKAFHFDLAYHLGRNSQGLVVSSAVAAAANVGLNLLLIPRLGIVGAAYATLLAYLLGLAFSARLSRRVFSMPPSWPIWLRAGSVALAVAVGAAVGGMLDSGLAGLLAGISLGAILAAVAAFAVNLSGVRREKFSDPQVSLPAPWRTKRGQNDE